MRSDMTQRARASRALACLAVLIGSLLAASPASARILKTIRPKQLSREHEITLGSGIEYEGDEYGLPFLFEYGFTPKLKLTVEPSYVSVKDINENTHTGMGDLETTLTYELVTERRYRPAFALEAIVKWPTAPKGELGTGEADSSIGAILSKEFVRFDLDFNVLYTRVGSPPGVHLSNTLETSLAVEWHPTPHVDIEAEIVYASGSGVIRGQPGTIVGLGASDLGGSETEATLGIAEHLSDRFKLEEGVVITSDSQQLIFAWEWEFGGRKLRPSPASK